MSVKKRGKRWQVRVYCGIDPETGAEVYKSGTADKRADAIDLESELRKQWRERPSIAVELKDLTMRGLLDEWWELARPNIAPNTQRVERGYIDSYVLAHGLDRVLVTGLTARHLDTHYRWLTSKGLAPSTIRRVHGIIRRALAQAVRWELVPRNVTASATPPKVIAGAPESPEVADVRALAEWLEKNRTTHRKLHALVTVATSTGARPGELTGLRWDRIDFAGESVKIETTVGRGLDGAIERPTTKTGRIRTVPIGPVVVQVLRDYRKHCAETALKTGRPIADHVFPNATGGPWGPDGAGRALRHATDKANVDVTLYGIRHFVATNLIAAGEDVRSVADRLGCDPAVLLKVYAASVPAKGRQLADRMEAVLRG